MSLLQDFVLNKNLHPASAENNLFIILIASSYRSAQVWNHTDSEVKQASSFKAFKDIVKEWFILLFPFIYLCIIVIKIEVLNDVDNLLSILSTAPWKAIFLDQRGNRG